jgi:hypothetical protein
MSDTTRLAISGVSSRVALHVAERRDTSATLEQKLPFLAIGTEVADETGRTGRISRVAVALEGGVPKIVLELAYDAQPLRASTPPGARVRRDETVSYERPSVPGAALAALRTPVSHGDRSQPLKVAFPLEIRRPTKKPGPFAWLTRLFAPFSS